MAELGKADVERLLDAIDKPPAELREALTSSLRIVLEREGDWGDLIQGNGWPPARVEALMADDQEALWDLAAELNELRGRDQREAVSAIERAIKAIAVADAAGIRRAARAIGQLDRAAVYGDLPAQLDAVADDIDAGRPVRLDGVATALGPGPLSAELRRLPEEPQG